MVYCHDSNPGSMVEVGFCKYLKFRFFLKNQENKTFQSFQNIW